MQVISEKRVNGELDRDSARVVSLVRTLGALENLGLSQRRGTLLRGPPTHGRVISAAS